MAKVIIGIHGLGNKPEEIILKKWWKQSINEGLKANFNKTDNFKFELIYWADILHDKPLDESITDTKSPYFLDEVYTPSPNKPAPETNYKRLEFLDAVENQLDKLLLNDDLTLNYSKISDVIIHKYFRDLEIYYTNEKINLNGYKGIAKEIIRKKVAKIILSHKNDEIFLIAHSMGSIIAYDVLKFIIPDIKINTFVTIGSPLGLPIVRSKIAAEMNNHEVKNKKLQTPDNIVKNWFNFSDPEDKVAINYDLNDNYYANKKGVQPIDFIIHNNYEMDSVRNPHKSFGYLRTKELSLKINNFLLYEKQSAVKRIIKSLFHFFRK